MTYWEIVVVVDGFGAGTRGAENGWRGVPAAAGCSPLLFLKKFNFSPRPHQSVTFRAVF
jgi:hypothetical protein